MPEHVDAEQIQAEYNNGVLSINLPKRVEEKKKPAVRSRWPECKFLC